FVSSAASFALLLVFLSFPGYSRYLPSFPTRRSSDLTRIVFSSDRDAGLLHVFVMNADGSGVTQLTSGDFVDDDPVWSTKSPEVRDRKSTRLNSSHQIISYAVFCLKKKKKNK